MLIRCEYTRLVLIDELKPNPENENTHSEEQISFTADILNYQGWREPIRVSNQSGFIVSGHCRRLASIKLGWKEVPVTFQDYESPDQEFADRVAANALARQSFIDMKKVNSKIPQLSPDFNIRMTGLKNFFIDPSEKEKQPPVFIKCPECGESFDPKKIPRQ